MFRHETMDRAFLVSTAVYVLAMGLMPLAVGSEDETEILRVTVGKPTFLSTQSYQSPASMIAKMRST